MIKLPTIRRTIILISVAISMRPHVLFAQENKESPYARLTGTVHQMGFMSGIMLIDNPNKGIESTKNTYTDLCLGAVYCYRNYLTPQVNVEATVSTSFQTAKYLDDYVVSGHGMKIVTPADFRLCVGPNEDFMVYIGCGLQWNVVSRSANYDEEYSSNIYSNNTIHQLAGNTVAGIMLLGPSRHRIHASIGCKCHFPLSNSSIDSKCVELNIVDMARERSCVTLTGNVSYDLDKRKKSTLMFNYELPLGHNGQVDTAGSTNGILTKTQMISLALMFYMGGSR